MIDEDHCMNRLRTRKHFDSFSCTFAGFMMFRGNVADEFDDSELLSKSSLSSQSIA
jgi:hypothetical protein